MAERLPQPPRHLSAESRRWWREIVTDYELEAHHLRLLQAACECWDRVLQARAAVERDGAYYRDRFEQIKPHPALAEERQSKVLMARLLRELALDVEAPNDSVGRPPQIAPGAGRRAR
jgi:P27 family predicted phage terminase small subunit